jgi:ADP-ribose pyrophosphatase YjhB (NUDIX family)
METNIINTKIKLEAEQLLSVFDKVKVDEKNYSISIHDFEEDHSYAAIYTWQVDEDRAYSEDLTQPFPLGDDVDNITSASEFEAWIDSYYE